MSEDNSTEPNTFFGDFVPDGKVCNRCRTRKPFSEYFIGRKKGRETRRPYCKLCDLESKRKRRAKKPLRPKRTKEEQEAAEWKAARRKLLQKKHGLTVEEYESILAAQNGVCRICGNTDGERCLAVDHDHETGKQRDLLCLRCNRAIGLLRDSPTICRALADYLERHGRTQ